MGNWDISIKGTGQHHNGVPEDAEQMAAEFVKKLQEAGHTIEHAAMTHGARIDLTKPDQIPPLRK